MPDVPRGDEGVEAAGMGSPKAATLLLMVAVVVAGCVPAAWSNRPTAANRHDQAVEALEQRVSSEQGWLVLELPNPHEGGGSITWWLHPCDPGTETRRRVHRTGYHGSDTPGPGLYVVEEDELDCTVPARIIEVGERTLELDVETIELDSILALLEAREQVTITDRADGETYTTVRGQPTYGPCDGHASWYAHLEPPRELWLRAEGCTGTVGALPEDARALLRPSREAPNRRSTTQVRPGAEEELAATLAAAGWEPDAIRSYDFDEIGTLPVWYGPCGRDPSGDRVRTMVVLDDGFVSLHEHACDGR